MNRLELYHGTLTIENAKMREFMRGFEPLEERALHCQMKNMARQETVSVSKSAPRAPVAAMAAGMA